MSNKEPAPLQTDKDNMDASQVTMINIMAIAKEAKVEGLEFEAPSNSRVGNAPILDNGLNLLYAPQSYGKSYTSISIAVESGLPSLFIDLESNGKMFIDHCKRNRVAYAYAGDAGNILDAIKELAKAIKKKHGKAFIIIDSYSDLFQDDEGKMAQFSQKNLGVLHRFFMREVKMPVLILDHATEQWNKDGEMYGFKIEGNKSGKFKKTVAVLRLDQIGGNIENGTFVTVERSRNHDDLPRGHTQYYHRNDYLVKKLQSLIDSKKLNEEFTATDLASCMCGDDRDMWRKIQNEIATSREDSRKTLWKLNSKE